MLLPKELINFNLTNLFNFSKIKQLVLKLKQLNLVSRKSHKIWGYSCYWKFWKSQCENDLGTKCPPPPGLIGLTNFFWPRFFSNKNIFRPKVLWPKNKWWPNNFVWPKISFFFLTKSLLSKNLLYPKFIFLTKNFCWPKIFYDHKFSSQWSLTLALAQLVQYY